MANAELKIVIQDDGARGPGGGGGSSGGGSSGGSGGGGSGGSGLGSYQRALAAATGDPIGPAGRSFSQIGAARAAGTGAYGRPLDATDEEWAFYQLEQRRRATESAKQARRVSVNAERQKREAEAEERRREAEEALAAKEAERQQRWQFSRGILGRIPGLGSRLPEKIDAADEQRIGGYAGTAANGMVGFLSGQQGALRAAGGSIGGTAGAVAGGALGGPVGAALGQVAGTIIGDTVGRFLEDPLFPVTGALKAFQKGLEFVGEGAKKVAANDGLGALTHGLNGAADVLERIPIAGKFASEALRTLGTAANVAVNTMNAFADRGKQIAGYSGAISVAVAQQNVAKTLADLREAQRFGDGFGRMIDAQTRFEASMRGMIAPIKAVILERLPQMIDIGTQVLINNLKMLDKMHFGNTIFGKMAQEMEDERNFAKAITTTSLWNWWTGFSSMGFAPTVGGPVGGPLGLPITGPGAAPAPIPFAPPGAP